MPTYTFRCDACGELVEPMIGLREYVEHPPVFIHCGHPMQRVIVRAPAVHCEADYTGLRASDGTDISTRTKHRKYMREHGLTTMDDFTETWKRAERERADRLAGIDPTRTRDIADAIEKLGG